LTDWLEALQQLTATAMTGKVLADVSRIQSESKMLEEDPNDPMPDRMNIWTTLGSYGAGALSVFLMFYLALPATSSLN
jgi:hypothetical protein